MQTSATSRSVQLMPSGSVSRHSVSVLAVVQVDVGEGGVVTGSDVIAGDVITVGCARVSIS